MTREQEYESELFDQWPEKYDTWFTTPVGLLVKKYETDLLLDMLDPRPGEYLLDVGCGTGVFTQDILSGGARIVGLDISYPMLVQAKKRTPEESFTGIAGDMSSLPFADNSFDKVYSMTALEFVTDAGKAIDECIRVAHKGAKIVVTTLNSLSPWAEQRKKKAKHGHLLFQSMTFRSPDELLDMVPGGAIARTAIHFQKNDHPADIPEIEAQGMNDDKDTGAFVAVSWIKQ